MGKPQKKQDETSGYLASESHLWQPPLPPLENVPQEAMLDSIMKRVKNLKKEGTVFPTITKESLEQLLGEENLIAQEGEQKYYILPDQAALQKLMDTIPAVASGEFSQSRRWHKTNVELKDGEGQSWSKMAELLQQIEERLARIENLLSK